MKPALAKAKEPTVLEDLGRATLQIVHDLKNQLNGLKLYATFLRKRLESSNQADEERETLQKLIAGLDRAAKDMTALVRYAQPLELHPQARTDLRKILSNVLAEAATRETGGLSRETIAPQIEDEPLFGDFDPAAMNEAIKAVTDDVGAAGSAKETNTLSLTARREQSEVLLEWRGAKFNTRNNPFRDSIGYGTMRIALAARIIEAHGGHMKCEADLIRVWLPLSKAI